MSTNITDGTQDLLAAIVEALDVPDSVYNENRGVQLRNAAADVRGVLAGVLEDGAGAAIAAKVLRQATAGSVEVLAS